MRGEGLNLVEVFGYLEECDAKLLAELELARDVLHRRPPQGWTAAQVVHHLIRCETAMMAIWTLAPALRRWPRLLSAIDRSNVALWRAMGMRIVEPVDGPVTRDGAESGRFKTPVFLDPMPRRFEFSRLGEWRRSARARTRRAVEAIDERDLKSLHWTLPHAGPHALIELVEFIGIHEMHHLPQIRRIREL